VKKECLPTKKENEVKILEMPESGLIYPLELKEL